MMKVVAAFLLIMITPLLYRCIHIAQRSQNPYLCNMSYNSSWANQFLGTWTYLIL